MRGSCRLALAVGAVLTTVACFSDRAPAEPEVDVVDCLLPVEAVRRGDRVVVLRDFAFLPDSIVVERGQTVTWVNCEPPGGAAHTATVDDRTWSSPLLHPGDAYSRTFHDAGHSAYFCLPHAAMRGTVVVR